MSGFLSKASFQKQLTIALAASIMALTLCGSALTSWLISDQVRTLVVSQATQLTGQFAENSVVAFLVDDLSIVQRQMAMMQSFPGVRYVAILRDDYAPLVADGEPVSLITSEPSAAWRDKPGLAGEDEKHWHFIAPVYTRPSESPYDSTQAVSKKLGYVHVALSKTSVKSLSLVIAMSNIVISFTFAAFLIVWLSQAVKRLTRPLADLANVMVSAQSGTRGPTRATIHGPPEIREIGMVFNAMMERLEGQKDLLESQVAIRTLEANEARDAALTAAHHKAEFLAAVSHEMRTPLHSINGYTQLAIEKLEKRVEQGSITNYLNIVRDSANDLLAHINQILEFAKIEANKIELKLQEFNLGELIEDIEEKVQPLVQSNANELIIKLNGRANVVTDKNKLLQILLNLLTNACKFTDNGTIWLGVTCSPHHLRIEVKDTGIGIAADKQEEIFQPFRQGDMSDTREYAGTGLGLAITKNFCERLGGTISVESESSVGSTFSVTIPLPTHDILSDASPQAVENTLGFELVKRAR
jgi:two-component system sensor histidine kinase BarA